MSNNNRMPHRSVMDRGTGSSRQVVRMNEDKFVDLVTEAASKVAMQMVNEMAGGDGQFPISENAVQLLSSIRDQLSDVYEQLIALNRNGSQFDYVSNSRLGDIWGSIEEISRKIGRVIWQR